MFVTITLPSKMKSRAMPGDDGHSRGVSRTDKKPRANNSFPWVKRRYCGDAVDAVNPLQYDAFPLGRALSSAG